MSAGWKSWEAAGVQPRLRVRGHGISWLAASLLAASLGCGSDEQETGPRTGETQEPSAAIGQPFEDQDLEAIAAYQRELEAADSEEEVIRILDDLAFVSHPAAIEPLAGHLHDERTGVVFEAIDGLEDLGGAASVRPLADLIDEPGRGPVKVRVVEALWYMAEEDLPTAVGALIRALGDEHPQVREDASTALRALDQPSVTAQMMRAYEEGDLSPQAKSGLARLLRQLGETSVPAPSAP